MILNHSLVQKLQVWGFEDGKLIFKDMSLGSVLEVRQKDISCATDELLNALHGAICDFLNGLPQGLSIQFVQVIDSGIADMIERHEADLAPEADELTKKLLNERTRQLRSLDLAGEIPNQKLYVILRKSFVRTVKRERLSFRIWKKRDVAQDWSRRILDPELKRIPQLKPGFKAS